MSLQMQIVKAEEIHAESLSEMWRRSIKELCFQDHHNNLDILNNWLSNKSPKSLASAFAEQSLAWYVAINNKQVIGVCMFGYDGILRALYIHPEFTNQHVGSSLLKQAETYASQKGIREFTLESTSTAKQFYLAHYYVEYDCPKDCFGVVAFPMKKLLSNEKNGI